MRWVSIAMAVAAVLVPRSASAGDYAPLNCAKASSSYMRFAGPMPWANWKLGGTLYGIATSLVAMGQRGESKTRRGCG